jgi:uncharacterized YccA/Bax inhibitor family protein
MSPKAGMSLAVLIGSTIGSYIPILFGVSFLSYASLFVGGIGGLLGIYIAYKIYF